jgi:hypothetical protein
VVAHATPTRSGDAHVIVTLLPHNGFPPFQTNAKLDGLPR